jgi:hypothetical protein
VAHEWKWREQEGPAGVEDGLVVGDEDVDAVYVAAAGGDAVGQLGHDAYRVLAARRTETRVKLFTSGKKSEKGK